MRYPAGMLTTLLAAALLAPPGGAEGARAFVNAHLIPVSGPEIPTGALVVEDGVITAVGASADVSIPIGAEVRDLEGKTLMPGLIAMAERNRHHFQRFQLVEIGSVFFPGHEAVEQSQSRSMALAAVQAGKKADAVVWNRVRSALDGWARQVLDSAVEFRETRSCHPWEDAVRVAEVIVAERCVGRATILPLSCKQKIGPLNTIPTTELLHRNTEFLAKLGQAFSVFYTIDDLRDFRWFG